MQAIVSPTTDASRAELMCPVILIGLFSLVTVLVKTTSGAVRK
jgi:hypothetical protein